MSQYYKKVEYQTKEIITWKHLNAQKREHINLIVYMLAICSMHDTKINAICLFCYSSSLIFRSYLKLSLYFPSRNRCFGQSQKLTFILPGFILISRKPILHIEKIRSLSKLKQRKWCFILLKIWILQAGNILNVYSSIFQFLPFMFWW